MFIHQIIHQSFQAHGATILFWKWNYCGYKYGRRIVYIKESDYGPASFNIENADQNYIRSNSEISITPDFPFGFNVQQYLVAIGSSNIDDIVPWTAIQLSGNSTLDLTGLSLENYNSYTISLQGVNGEGDSNDLFSKSFTVYTDL